LGADDSREGVVRHLPPLRPASAVVRQDLEAPGYRGSEVTAGRCVAGRSHADGTAAPITATDQTAKRRGGRSAESTSRRAGAQTDVDPQQRVAPTGGAFHRRPASLR